MTEIQNGWYLAAWSEEVGRTFTQRWIAGNPVCFYRLLDGTPVAVEDRCPHRRYPLSLGRLDGDVLECNYHGYRFDGTGRCTGVAEQRDTPKARARHYRLAERHGVLWLWPGDPEAADETLLPDTSWLDSPQWTGFHGVLPLKARHLLLVENLLDLSHETFLHPTTIGNRAVAATPIDVTTTERVVSFTRHMTGIEAPPFYVHSMGLTSPVDRWQDGDFHPPGIFILHIRLAPTGTSEPEGFHMKVLYGLTPAAGGECHDFYAVCRDFALDDAGLTDYQHKQQLAVMREDIGALEAQEHMVATSAGGAPESSIRSDLAALRARRMLDRMRAAETAAR
jgi:vanillate O-demethylase monooxygenase subunit